MEWNAGAPATMDSSVKAELALDDVAPRCVAHARCCATPPPPPPPAGLAAAAEIFRSDSDAWNPLAADGCFSSSTSAPALPYPLRKREENDGALMPKGSAAASEAYAGDRASASAPTASVGGALHPRASSTSSASVAEAMSSMAAPALWTATAVRGPPRCPPASEAGEMHNKDRSGGLARVNPFTSEKKSTSSTAS